MSNLEHYFENLLFEGQDIKGDLNKNTLSKEQQDAVWECANYVLFSLFPNRETFLRWIKERSAWTSAINNPPWISAITDPPEEDGHYLAATSYCVCEAVCIHCGNNKVRWRDPVEEYEDYTKFITHWMPLPKPPKEEG